MKVIMFNSLEFSDRKNYYVGLLFPNKHYFITNEPESLAFTQKSFMTKSNTCFSSQKMVTDVKTPQATT